MSLRQQYLTMETQLIEEHFVFSVPNNFRVNIKLSKAS